MNITLENHLSEGPLITLGNSQGPLLVCIPGLLGGPEDFTNYVPTLGEHFQVVIANPTAKARQIGLSNLSQEVLSEVIFDSTSQDLFENLQKAHPNKKYYFLGISLGGKVVYDFALRFPHFFRGGIITDVGLSSFESSPLFSLVERIVNGVNLNLPWDDLRNYLRQSIPEKNLRVLIQSQIQYPSGTPPAKWKVGMKNFKSLLQRQSIDEQFEDYKKIDSILVKNGSYIHVIKSDSASGISDESYHQMKDLKSICFHHYCKTGHFLHISHREEIIRLILSAFIFSDFSLPSSPVPSVTK